MNISGKSINLDAFNDSDADVLIRNVNPRHGPIFERGRYSDYEKRAIYRYLFSRRPRKLPPSLKHRLINLHDPIADRSGRFPDGLRWCLNVYVGCDHNCGYCYVNGYSQEGVGTSPHPKVEYKRKLLEDLDALRSLGVPKTPLHMSNSTDPLQENLEKGHRHTLYSLQKIQENRSLFSSLVMLTKNPGMLCEEPYLSLIASAEMQPFTLQVTCAFWNDESRAFYEPHAPNVQGRLEAIKVLAGDGIDVELRIDPLFPASRFEDGIRGHKPLPDYAIPEAQSREDIVNLVRFAREAGATAIIVSVLKIPIGRSSYQCKEWFKDIYRDSNPDQKRKVRSASWRLPAQYERALISEVAEICTRKGIAFKHCMQDVLSRY
jgi:DNA repair photolyase